MKDVARGREGRRPNATGGGTWSVAWHGVAGRFNLCGVRSLRLAYSDFWPGFDPGSHRLLRLLAARRGVVLGSFEDADVLVYSDYGERHWGFQGPKVYLTAENMLPDFDQCDLAFGPDGPRDDPRFVRYPYFAQALPLLGSLVRGPDHDPSAFMGRDGFCAFVASNPRAPERNRFFRMLRRRRPVESGGKHFNTTGRRVPDKLSFLRGFRFNLAFENTRSPGYVTEKLVEPLLVGCIPIYWGAPDVHEAFNPGCMIDVSAYPTLEDAVEGVLRVDDDPAARLRLLSTPPFRDNQPPECLSDDYLAGPVLRWLDSGPRPGRRRYRHRRLREHVYGSAWHQTRVSLACRLDGLLWRMGWRR